MSIATWLGRSYPCALTSFKTSKSSLVLYVWCQVVTQWNSSSYKRLRLDRSINKSYQVPIHCTFLFHFAVSKKKEYTQWPLTLKLTHPFSSSIATTAFMYVFKLFLVPLLTLLYWNSPKILAFSSSWDKSKLLVWQDTHQSIPCAYQELLNRIVEYFVRMGMSEKEGKCFQA